MKKDTHDQNNDGASKSLQTNKGQNKKPVSKKLGKAHDDNNAVNNKRAHHRGSDEQDKDLKDTSTRATRESDSYRSDTTKK